MNRKASRLDRLDRKLGTAFARVAGTLTALGGLGAAWSVLTQDDFTWSAYWPVLAMAAALLLIARACFRARPSFLDLMSEVPLTRSEAAARGRNVTVDDQGGG
jgi:hypothetical protein